MGQVRGQERGQGIQRQERRQVAPNPAVGDDNSSALDQLDEQGTGEEVSQTPTLVMVSGGAAADDEGDVGLTVFALGEELDHWCALADFSITSMLDRLDAEAAATVRARFAATYGRDLDAVLAFQRQIPAGDTPIDMRQMRALVEVFGGALSGPEPDLPAFRSVFAQLTERQAAAMQLLYGERWGGDLHEILAPPVDRGRRGEEEQWPEIVRREQGELPYDPDRMFQVAYNVWDQFMEEPPDLSTAAEMLQRLGEEERHAVVEAFDHEFPGTFETQLAEAQERLAQHARSEQVSDVADLLADADPDAFFSSTAFVEYRVRALDTAQMSELERVYTDRYGEDVHAVLVGLGIEVNLEVIAQIAAQLRGLLLQPQPDPDALRGVIYGLDHDEVAALALTYAETFGADLGDATRAAGVPLFGFTSGVGATAEDMAGLAQQIRDLLPDHVQQAPAGGSVLRRGPSRDTVVAMERLLRPLHQDELNALREAYRALTGGVLDAHVRRAGMSVANMDSAVDLRAVAWRVDELVTLFDSYQPMRTRYERLMAGTDPNERFALEAQFQRRAGKSLEQAVADTRFNESPDDLDGAEQIEVSIDLRRIMFELDSLDPTASTIVSILEDLTATQVAVLRQAYRSREGWGLEGRLSEVFRGDDLDRLLAALEPQAADPTTAAIEAIGDMFNPSVRLVGPYLVALRFDQLAQVADAMDFPNKGAVYRAILELHGKSALAGIDPEAAERLTRRRDTTPQAPVDMAKVQGVVKVLWDNLACYGTGERGVHDALFGLTAREIWAVEGEYETHHNIELRAHIVSEMSGDDRSEALAYIDTDLPLAHAYRLRNSASWIPVLGNDEETRIEDTLRALTPDEILALRERGSWDKTVKEMLDTVEGRLGGNDQEVFKALVQGELALADAIRLDEALGTSWWGLPWNWDEDEEAVDEITARGDEAHRQAVMDAYEARTGESAVAEIKRLLGGAERDIAVANLENDPYAAAAARLQNAADGIGTTEDVMKEVYEGKSDSVRSAIDWAFEEAYGSEWDGPKVLAVDNMLWHEAETRLQYGTWDQYRRHGELEPGFALYASMKGAGSDLPMFKQALEGKTLQEVQRILSEFREVCREYGELDNGEDSFELSDNYEGDDLDLILDWIAADFSGRDRSEAERLLLGKPESVSDMFHDARSRYWFERENNVSGWAVDLAEMPGEGSRSEDVDEAMRKLAAMVDDRYNLRAGITRAEFELQYNRVVNSVDTYTTAKTAVVDGLKTGVEIAVAAIVTVLTKGAAAPWLVAVCSAACSGAAGIAFKLAMEGAAYGEGAIAVDALKTAFGAALGGSLAQHAVLMSKLDDLAKTFGEGATRAILAEAFKGAVSGAANAALEGILNEANWRAGFDQWALGIAQNAGAGGARGFLAGLVSETTKTGLDADPSSWTQVVGAEALASVAASHTTTLLTPATWQGSPSDIVLALLSGYGQAAGEAVIAGSVDWGVERRNQARRVEARQQERARIQPVVEALMSGAHPREIAGFEAFSEVHQEEIYQQFAVIRLGQPGPHEAPRSWGGEVPTGP